MISFITVQSEKCWNSAKHMQVNLMSWYAARCAGLLKKIVMPQ